MKTITLKIKTLLILCVLAACARTEAAQVSTLVKMHRLNKRFVTAITGSVKAHPYLCLAAASTAAAVYVKDNYSAHSNHARAARTRLNNLRNTPATIQNLFTEVATLGQRPAGQVLSERELKSRVAKQQKIFERIAQLQRDYSAMTPEDWAAQETQVQELQNRANRASRVTLRSYLRNPGEDAVITLMSAGLFSALLPTVALFVPRMVVSQFHYRNKSGLPFVYGDYTSLFNSRDVIVRSAEHALELGLKEKQVILTISKYFAGASAVIGGAMLVQGWLNARDRAAYTMPPAPQPAPQP